MHPTASLERQSSKYRGAIYTIEFNPRQRNFIASGDSSGLTQIWKLNWQLSNIQNAELQFLNEIAEFREILPHDV